MDYRRMRDMAMARRQMRDRARSMRDMAQRGGRNGGMDYGYNGSDYGNRMGNYPHSQYGYPHNDMDMNQIDDMAMVVFLLRSMGV